jgi:hypothetical protein
LGVAAKAAVGDHFNVGQEGGQGAGGGGFGRAPLAPNQHAANARADGVQNKRPFHLLLTNDSGKWKYGVTSHVKNSCHLFFKDYAD